jgi:hypothetical protein
LTVDVSVVDVVPTTSPRDSVRNNVGPITERKSESSRFGRAITREENQIRMDEEEERREERGERREGKGNEAYDMKMR